MFRQPIVESPLIGEYQNEFHIMGRVFGNEFEHDVSFVSTLRALVLPRMDDDEETLEFKYRTSYVSQRDIERNTPDHLMRFVTMMDDASDMCGNTLYVINVGTPDEKTETNLLSLIEEKFQKKFPGLTKVEKFTVFFRKIFRASCYLDAENKTSIVFCSNLDIRRYHFLQIAVPVMLPWYFTKDKALTPEEMELIESFKEKTPEKYLGILEKVAARYDFRSMRIKSELSGFETKYLEAEASKVARSVDSIMRDVRSHESSISDLLRTYNELNIRLMGLNAKIAEGNRESEITDYFLVNKNISLNVVNGGDITFTCRGYVEYFDEEIVRKYMENPRSILYRVDSRDMSGKIPPDDVKMLFQALFVDEELRMKFCAMYTISVSGGVKAISGAKYTPQFGDCTPNPHIDRYSCLGNNERAIREQLMNHNYVGAIEQCISSCKSLNFADSAVISEFMRRFYGISKANMKCIELPTGETVTPIKAIEWLKERNARNAQPKQEEEETHE